MSCKGRKNVYTCERCGRFIVTIDRDEGVTPFLIGCQFGCKAAMKSAWYRIHPSVEPTLIPLWEWYAPNEAQKATLSTPERDHVDRGGLLLRKISEDPGPNAFRTELVTDEHVAKLRGWLGPMGIDLFRGYRRDHGELSPVIVPNEPGGIPHVVHFNEGMQIRNFLRSTGLCDAWNAHDFDNLWQFVVERAI